MEWRPFDRLARGGQIVQTWELLVMIVVFAFAYVGGGHAYHARYAKKRAPKLLCVLYGGSHGKLALPVVVLQAIAIGHAAHTLVSQWITGTQDRRYAFVTAGLVLASTLLYWGLWRLMNRTGLWD